MAIPMVITAQTRPSTPGRGMTVYSPKTGDALMDQHLQEIDRHGLAEFAVFKNELASKFSGSKRVIGRIYPKDKIEPGDTFIEPGDTFIEPGDTFIEPGDNFIEPGDNFIEPGDNFIEPIGIAPEPDMDTGKVPGVFLPRPGDAYYACALSLVTGKSADVIIKSFAKNQDWGVITRELGINPDSKEFENLQAIVLGGIGKVPGKTIDTTPRAMPTRRR